MEISTPHEYAPVWSIQILVELQTPGAGRREACGMWRAVFGWWHVACGRWQVVGGGQSKSWHRSMSKSDCYLECSHWDEMSWCLMAMVLRIAALGSVGMVDIWVLGRADLQLRFSRRICCLLPIDCGRMCVYSVWTWWWCWRWSWRWRW